MARRQAHIGKADAAKLNRVRAIKLRITGQTVTTIAEQLGVSKPSACRYVQTALGQLAALQEKDAEQLRTLQRERLDALLAAVWPQAQEGDLKAIQTVVKIMERLSKLLGLDAPEKHDHRMVAAVAVQKEAKKYRDMSTEELNEICRAYLEP